MIEELLSHVASPTEWNLHTYSTELMMMVMMMSGNRNKLDNSFFGMDGWMYVVVAAVRRVELFGDRLLSLNG